MPMIVEVFTYNGADDSIYKGDLCMWFMGKGYRRKLVEFNSPVTSHNQLGPMPLYRHVYLIACDRVGL